MKLTSQHENAVLRTFSLLVFGLLTQSTTADILTRLPRCGEDSCHCTGAPVEEGCPALPTINNAVVTQMREIRHDNPMTIQCDPLASDPFANPACVQGLTTGEACVVELLAPTGSTDACPVDYSYRLVTVPSLSDALDAGEYVTHTGACGACSSLQDLATLIETTQLPMKANDCYWNSGGLANPRVAQSCFEVLGFSSNCARVMSSFQDRVNRRCPSFCAAFALGQGQSSPACEQSSVCYPCMTQIEQRFRTVAGRVDVNSGYPSWSAASCDAIAPLRVVSQGEVCAEAKVVGGTTPPPVGAPVGIFAPTVEPTTPEPTANPTNQPTTAAPVPAPTPNPTTASPTPDPTTAAPTPDPTAAATPAPTPQATISANLQLCQEFAAIEVSLSRRTGGTVVCDCSESQQTAIPVCYKSSDRTEDQVCSIQFGSCNTLADCCSAGVRGCRRGQCRSASRTAIKSTLRIGTSAGRGGRGSGRVEAQPSRGETRGRRRIRGLPATTTSDNVNQQHD